MASYNITREWKRTKDASSALANLFPGVELDEDEGEEEGGESVVVARRAVAQLNTTPTFPSPRTFRAHRPAARNHRSTYL